MSIQKKKKKYRMRTLEIPLESSKRETQKKKERETNISYIKKIFKKNWMNEPITVGQEEEELQELKKEEPTTADHAPTTTASHTNLISGGDIEIEEDFAPQLEHLTTKEAIRRYIKESFLWLFPIFTWGPKCDKESLIQDVIGGLVLGIVFIPNVIAYASIIEAPLQPCLIGATIFSFSYFFTGNIPALSMGPTSEVNLMIASISNLPSNPDARAMVFQSVVLQVGIIALFFAFFQGGVIIRNSFAKAIGDAFACAAGIVIILGQLKTIANVSSPSSVLIHEILQNFGESCKKNANLESLYSTLFFFGLFLYLVAARVLSGKYSWIPKWFPHQIVVVVVAILITWLAHLDERIHLKILKSVPRKAYSPTVPPLDLETLSNTGVTSVVVTLVGFLQMYSIGTKISTEEVGANKELVSLGIMSLLGGFFGGIPGSSSFSRCSIMTDLNVKSPLCHGLSATVVAIAMAVLFELGVFYYLPGIATSAILCAAVLKLVDFHHAIYLFRHFKLDFCVWLVTWVLVMFAGVAAGILTGIGLAILIVLFKVAQPVVHTVGFEPNKNRYIPISVDSEVVVYPQILIWQFEAPFYFITIHNFSSKLVEAFHSENRHIDFIIVNCSRVVDIDATSVQLLSWQVKNLKSRLQVRIFLAALSPAIRKALVSWLEDPVDPSTIYATVTEAVESARAILACEDPKCATDAIPASLILRKKDLLAMQAEHRNNTHELTAIFGVVANAERLPKQRIRVAISEPELLRKLTPFLLECHERGCDEIKLKRGDEVLPLIVEACKRMSETSTSVSDTLHYDLVTALLTVSEGIHVHTVKLFPSITGHQVHSLDVICKWGATITTVGLHQAETFTRTFARRLGYLHQLFVVRCSSSAEERVLSTAEVVLEHLGHATGVGKVMKPITLRNDLLDDSLAMAKGVRDGRDAEIAKLLNTYDQSATEWFLHLAGLPELLQLVEVKAPWHAQQLVEAQLQSLVDTTAEPEYQHLSFAFDEPMMLLRRRYATLLDSFRGGSNGSGTNHCFYNPVIAVPIFQNVAYDLVENNELLSSVFDIMTLYEVSRRLSVVVRAARVGMNPSERFVTASVAVAPWLAHIRNEICAALEIGEALQQKDKEANETETGLPKSSRTVAGGVPLDLFFATSTFLEALRITLADARPSIPLGDATKQTLKKAELNGWHNMTHVFINVSKSSMREEKGAPDHEEEGPLHHHRVEIFFSSGAQLLLHVPISAATTRSVQNPLESNLPSSTLRKTASFVSGTLELLGAHHDATSPRGPAEVSVGSEFGSRSEGASGRKEFHPIKEKITPMTRVVELSLAAFNQWVENVLKAAECGAESRRAS